MRRILLCTGLIGCATAGRDSPGDGGDPTVDALPTVTLSQTADTTVVGGKGLACGGDDGVSITWTRENSWYRVFPLQAFGITTPFQVTEVAFGVQEAGPTTQMIQLKLGTYSGTPGATLDPALIAPLTSAAVSVPVVTSPQLVEAPIRATVPAGGQLVVELAAADYANQDLHFYAGASAGAETAPAYLRAPDCGVDQPESIKALNAMAGSLVITVTGTK